jgi:hypothetical protein
VSIERRAWKSEAMGSCVFALDGARPLSEALAGLAFLLLLSLLRLSIALIGE